VGVIVEAGVVKEGTPICVPSKEVSVVLWLEMETVIYIHENMSWSRYTLYDTQFHLANVFFQFVNIGVVTSVEQNHKQVESARKGMEVCLKIENLTGEAPKMFGRHFDHTDILTSKVRFYCI